MSNRDYYEYHESKESLMEGSLGVNDYFRCSVCDKDVVNQNMSEEPDICQDCFDGRNKNEDAGDR